ncbi:MAG: 2Fe-2S iron-sulfur cluster-binding protein [Xanthobacteraceae bacterium]
MTPATLIVNGRRVSAMIEPRIHLADFLREHCRLTGTHLGCEHGVCGACTVLLDEEPVRSCITFAAACEGRNVRTIEDFETDPVMEELREAFAREHALQCGFCTPGMLITARDIVQRLPGADEERIRRELAGNLCRCTGYLGIVRAVCSVVNMQARAPLAAQTQTPAATPMPAFFPASEAAPLLRSNGRRTEPDLTLERQGWSRFEESFVVNRPASVVWRLLDDIPAVAACLPGARLSEQDGHAVKGSIAVKLGPITAQFAGSATIERDEHAQRGLIRGAGSDRGSGSRTRGEVSYQVIPENEHTRVSLVVEYNIQGMLAQFSRPALVQDLGRRLVREFAANLDRRMAGQVLDVEPSAPLNAGKLFWHFLRERLRRLLGLSSD